MDAIKRLLFGSDRKLRFIWRAVLYYVAGEYIVFPALEWIFELAAHSFDLKPDLNAANIGFGELRNFFTAFICTGLFALYEHRRVDSYGLQLDAALKSPTFEGMAIGIVVPGLVALGMIALGGMQVHGLALSGTALLVSALAWLVACISVGLAEEFWFRSYFQQTLWKSIGFWPSSIVIALIFAAEHYFYKEGENIWDVISIVSISLLLSYSILRTGTLWFAVGFHSAFDYMQLFVIGTPNGSAIPVGRLLNVTFTGPAWLTGGVLGTEASFLVYPAMVLAWLFIWWRYRANPAFEPK
jgi:membrane protease YdiL (CAAX protease family)